MRNLFVHRPQSDTRLQEDPTTPTPISILDTLMLRTIAVIDGIDKMGWDEWAGRTLSGRQIAPLRYRRRRRPLVPSSGVHDVCRHREGERYPHSASIRCNRDDAYSSIEPISLEPIVERASHFGVSVRFWASGGLP